MYDEAFLDAELGPALDWQPASLPDDEPLVGRYVRLERLKSEHAQALYLAQQGDDRTWLYMPNGPFANEADFRAYIDRFVTSTDPWAYAVIPTDGEPAGLLTYLRMEPNQGSIEIGHIWYGSSIQRSPATTEVVYLTAKNAFENLGYRRFEWKCYSLNNRSRAAAERFGFTYEGTFRNHLIIRGRNRDTSWYSITAEEWPEIKAAFEAWLDPGNFDADGNQVRTLASFRES